MTLMAPMSDARQQHLVKCAEEVIGLVNCGADPTRATTKVAADRGLNGHEIDRVVHKTNQALTLAHLQSETGVKREAPFLITNAQDVKAKLFGAKTESVTNEDPLPQEIQRKINAKTASDSYQDNRQYRFAPKGGQTKTASVVHESKAPREVKPLEISNQKIAYEDACTAAARARQDLDVALTRSIEPFTYYTAPSFERSAKIAVAHGVQDETLDLIFRIGQLGRHSQVMPSLTKVAAVIRPSRQELDMAGNFLAVQEAIKTASDALAEKTLAKERLEAAKIARMQSIDKIASDLLEVSPSFDAAQASERASGLVDSSLGSSNHPGGLEGHLTDAFGGAKGEGKGPRPRPLYEKDVEQGTRNLNLQSALQTALADPYVAGHPVPKVVESLNRAIQLNPRFSEPELMSYLRHDLSTDGGVPLDLQLRAVQAHKSQNGAMEIK